MAAGLALLGTCVRGGAEQPESRGTKLIDQQVCVGRPRCFYQNTQFQVSVACPSHTL